MKRLAVLAGGLAALTLASPALPAAGQSGSASRISREVPAEQASAHEAAALAEAVNAARYWVEQYRRYQRIPAISVALVKGQETAWAQGFGHIDRAMRRPASAATIYSICSISKLFTAVAFMQEWERGTVRLDEPVTTYLPWARLAPDARDSVPVTMRALLTHSAGLPREAVNPYWTGPDFPFPTRAEIRAGIGGQEPLYPVAATFQYSNLGLTLVGEAVGAVSGMSYADYVQSRILDPLGMADTRPFIPADRAGGRMAVGWGSLESDGTRPEVRLFDARGINPAAGFSASVSDLARFAQWQFRLLGSDEAELLRPSTLREMHRVHYITPDRRTSWGLGFVNFQVEGREMVGHGGSCPGYRSSLLIDPAHEIAVAVAMNAMDDASLLARHIAALVSARLAAAEYPAPDDDAAALSEYVGIYGRQPWSAQFALVGWAGGLTSIAADTREPASDMDRLKPLGADRFQVITSRGEARDIVTFHRDAAGKVTHMERFGQLTYRKHPLE